MYNCIGIAEMYMNSDTNALLYIEKKDKWKVFLNNFDGSGVKTLHETDTHNKALKFLEKYIMG